MRNNPCPICKNDIDDLLILETEDDKKAIEPENVPQVEQGPEAQIDNNIVANDS